jgi:hypothetical protein
VLPNLARQLAAAAPRPDLIEVAGTVPGRTKPRVLLRATT